MATLNLSTNGPSITKSYQSVVNSGPPSGPAAKSLTYGQWALFVVTAPLVSSFQQDGGKESVMKVQSTGEGELVDLIDEFSDGRIQFAFVKVVDPNTTLPKSILIGWCGEGVPERTKGYFTSHLAAVSKLLHGYHVQITARSDRDLTPEAIVQKVADASGSKYSGGPATGSASSGGPPPPVASKPAFTPTRVGGGGGGSFNPLGSRTRVLPSSTGNVDADGWGEDAPPVTRTQLEKVESAYKPTKVNIGAVKSQETDERPNYPRMPPTKPTDNTGDVIRGAYQPIGKVDIAEIRRQAKEFGGAKDDRPTPVKGAYEPIGKVDIAAIRAKAQGPSGAASPPSSMSPAITGASGRSAEQEDAPKPLAERSAAFTQSERMTSLPKPKVANKFGSSASTFTGTKAPAPGGFSAKPATPAAPVGAASRTFADEGGKTPAQLWAEKKARQGGAAPSAGTSFGGPTNPVKSQSSGEGGWKSGYTGKSWAPVQTTKTGKSVASNASEEQVQGSQQEEAPSSAGGIGAIRSRLEEPAAPPPMDMASKPNLGASRGVAVPGLPTRPSQQYDDDDGPPARQTINIPSPPHVPRSPSPQTPTEMRSASPIRVAMPVGRGNEQDMEPPEERFSPPPVPAESIAQAAKEARNMSPEPQVEADELARGASEAAAASTFGGASNTGTAEADGQGKRALVQYDYEKAEDNEVELRDGEIVTNIDMVDPDWWFGKNSRGEAGLFPSNYVEIIQDEEPPAAAAMPATPAAPPASGGVSKLPTATAQYDYEAAEDNEISFPDGATITGVEFPDDDWWFGYYGGKSGLFPANYVQLDD